MHGIGLLFPGQGSQYVGMGKELAERFPAAREVFREADEALGVELSRLCWEGPEADLSLTVNAQPAILVHSLAIWRLLQPAGLQIGVAAGHSLGEFSAYVAAGVMEFADAVRSVRRRGELMLRADEERPGTMAAVLGLNDEEVVRVCRDAAHPGEDVVAANFNAPGQVVISGDREVVERAAELLAEAGARRVLPLNVSGAFHSPLMRVAEAGLHKQLAGVVFGPGAFPVVSNVTAAPVREPGAARRLLVEQLTSPVRWVACVRTMLDGGVRRFLELGPGNVLTGLLRRIERGAEGRSLDTAGEIEAFLGEEVTRWS